MTNYQLYARILRLSFICFPREVQDMDKIVREVVLPDSTLVWC